MDYEEMANLSNITFHQEVTPEQSMELITQEIIFTILAVIGIVANVAIIYTIFRFKRMRTVPNVFLANWAIADMCSLIMTPSSYRIISAIDDIWLSERFFCVLFQFDIMFHHTAIVFMIVVSLDWCIAAYCPRSSTKFRSFYKYLVVTLWLLVLLMSSGLIRMCLKQIYFHIVPYLFVFDYCTIFFLVIVLQCSRAVRKCRNAPLTYPTLMLTLATVYTFCWLAGFLNMFLLNFDAVHPVATILMECCIFSSSIINLTLLYRYNKDFQACFIQILKRPEHRYVDALSELENNGGDITNTSMAPISLENTNQEILTGGQQNT